jgi:replicative DNA helicase
LSVATFRGAEHDHASDTSSFDRVPPHDLNAERCVLGGCQLSKEAIGEVIQLIRARDFYRPAHETIFLAIVDMYGKGEPVDPVTLAEALQKSGDLAKVGGASYLHELVQAVPTAANAPFYAEIVAETAVTRRLIEAGTRIVQSGYQRQGDAADLVEEASREVFAVAQQRPDESLLPAQHGLDTTLDRIEAAGKRKKGELTGVPTGFADLDSLTQGLQDGQLIIVAGRPAMGKSTVALDFARAASIKHHRPTAIFSLEMSREDLHHRLLSAQGAVPLHHLRSGDLDEKEWTRLGKAQQQIADAPLYLDDSPELTAMTIRAKARRLKERGELDLVVVDYTQLVQYGGGRRPESRQQEVSDISRSFKLMAKELGVPVVALSQLNRGPEQRTDKRPMVSDLRESGSLEQDADMVILLHREDAYEKEHPRAGEADLIVGKHRNGPTATITVAFQGHYSRFVDMAQT